MAHPLVTVVCLCYNQAAFVRQALKSVRVQTHPAVQLIVVDDHSTDGSVAAITAFLREHPGVTFIQNSENLGNCKAFNKALPLVKGEYVIDLAADDILLPTRIAAGVESFAKAGPSAGVNFTDAEYIDAEGVHLGFHSERYPDPPEGDVYRALVERYFICPPTMMIRKDVMDQLKGYDEELAYEDFDFWVRSSREFSYCYTPAVLVQRRLHPQSMSEAQRRGSRKQLASTLRVCEKIVALNRTAEEQASLRRRLRYELRQCARWFRPGLLWKYARLYAEVA